MYYISSLKNGKCGVTDTKDGVEEFVTLRDLQKLHNMGVCYDRGKYFEAPCFDNGSSLFCINWTYRARKSLLENIQFAESVARPFSKFYDKQVEAVLALGCKPLVINKSKLNYLLASYDNELYDNSKIRLVKGVLLARLHKYEGVAFNYV